MTDEPLFPLRDILGKFGAFWKVHGNVYVIRLCKFQVSMSFVFKNYFFYPQSMLNEYVKPHRHFAEHCPVPRVLTTLHWSSFVDTLADNVKSCFVEFREKRAFEYYCLKLLFGVIYACVSLRYYHQSKICSRQFLWSRSECIQRR